ncbi:MAG: hypothetical protein U1D55_09070 [Phycisphaerae bacterium]
MRTLRSGVVGVIGLGLLTLGGCPSGSDIGDILDNLEIKIKNEVNNIQVQDPRAVTLPSAATGPVFINNDVTFVNDVSTDLVVAELPDITLIGFENLTGLDGYYRYLADGVLQGIYVFDGETLLLDYPCLTEIELLSEEYFDPSTGVLVDAFDLEGAVFSNGVGLDFQCGDAFIMSFDADGIVAGATPIDLLQ